VLGSHGTDESEIKDKIKFKFKNSSLKNPTKYPALTNLTALTVASEPTGH